MERNIRLMAFIVMFVCVSMITSAQMPGPAMEKPEVGEPGIPEIQPGPGDRMEGPPRGMEMKKHDPEREKEMQRNNSLMMMAEAHKGLAQLYEDQNKLDEAAAELYKIIELLRSNLEKNSDKPFFKRNIMGKVMPVYHHISELYLKNNRSADAEKLLLEGIAMF
ncbi:MAG: tetratricopeptide repeat protein, partial [Erysipelotrichia bacterium]|nr:tetratricopeptide repeat protein [Erysipelotrichia bacterium]